MRFTDPYLLSLLLLIVPLFFFGRFSGGTVKFSGISSFKSIHAGAKLNPRLILLVLRLFAITLFILALARPQSGKTFSKISSNGVDIMLAIDTSGSMRAMDFKIDDKPTERLTIVKNVVKDFIDKRTHDRIGLIVFGDEAFTQCPLTLDHGILIDFLDRTHIGMVGESTAIGQAIGTTVNRLKDIKSKSRILILLTDGRNNSGQIGPMTAAKISNTYNIKIYTVGVGTRGKAPFLTDTFFGKRFVYQDVDIDEETLQEIAQATGGKYYRAANSEELVKIYDDIDKLEKTEVKINEYTEYEEQFKWFLLVGIMVLLVEILLSNTKLRKIP